MKTRLELAAEIAALVNANGADSAAKVWAKGDAVRVYCKKDGGGKKGWQEAGCITVELDGTANMDEKFKFAFHIDRACLIAPIAALPPAAPQEATPVVERPAVEKRFVDEDEQQFIDSQIASQGPEAERFG